MTMYVLILWCIICINLVDHEVKGDNWKKSYTRVYSTATGPRAGIDFPFSTLPRPDFGYPNHRIPSAPTISTCVTGGTGVLGKALVRGLYQRGYPLGQLYFTSRNRNATNALITELAQHKHSQYCYPGYLQLDVALEREEGYEHMVYQRLPLPVLSNVLHTSQHKVLINNLATCIPGHSHDALYRSLLINTLTPMKLAIDLLENCIDEDQITVLNVSSGDGERVYLHSSIQKVLNSIISPIQLIDYIHRLMKTYKPQLEYSYGDTPMYSLSKALLNKATEVLHHYYSDLRTQTPYRIVSICPGNFLSSMTRTKEEIEESTSNDALPIETVAGYILNAIDQDLYRVPGIDEKISIGPYTSGKFYRYGKEISV